MKILLLIRNNNDKCLSANYNYLGVFFWDM